MNAIVQKKIFDAMSGSAEQYKIRSCHGLAKELDIPLEHIEAGSLSLALKQKICIIPGPSRFRPNDFELWVTLLSKPELIQFMQQRQNQQMPDEDEWGLGSGDWKE